MKTVAILGSTGSIGTNALKVIKEKSDEFKVVALASGANHTLLAKQIKEFSPKLAAIRDEDSFEKLKKLPKPKKRIKLPTPKKPGESFEKLKKLKKRKKTRK